MQTCQLCCVIKSQYMILMKKCQIFFFLTISVILQTHQITCTNMFLASFKKAKQKDMCVILKMIISTQQFCKSKC